MAHDRSRPATPLAEAGDTLNRFVRVEAANVARHVGFGWRGDPQAPADYHSLLSAYVRSRATGRPLPVSDQHSDTTIYTTAEANLAFRFWHDLTHVRLGRGFDLAGEMAVASAQLDVLRAAGLGPGSLEYELFHIDTVGQTLCGAATGEFPRDQACFARTSIELDLSRAIRAELRKAM